MAKAGVGIQIVQPNQRKSEAVTSKREKVDQPKGNRRLHEKVPLHDIQTAVLSVFIGTGIYLNAIHSVYNHHP